VATSLLLDTHVLLWVATRDDRLGPRARDAIRDGTTTVFVSAVTAWEIAIKRALGKVEVPGDVMELVRFYRFDALDITIDHALGVEALPSHHRDPFDRLLVSQARSEGLTLVSNDARLAEYDVSYLPATR